jgi:hypothetical protein
LNLQIEIDLFWFLPLKDSAQLVVAFELKLVEVKKKANYIVSMSLPKYGRVVLAISQLFWALIKKYP